MKDPTSQLRSATRRAKSDVANKLVGMFLHELSRKIGQSWSIKVDGQEYEELVRRRFDNKCPYCGSDLVLASCVVEHLDGMNRYRAGLHVPGNVLVACKKCNSEKRRDDSIRQLSLAESGWESFLSHDSTRCPIGCATCYYWGCVWPDDAERRLRLGENMLRIRSFRNEFSEFVKVLPSVMTTLRSLSTKLYADCQAFAEMEIKSLLEKYDLVPSERDDGNTP